MNVRLFSRYISLVVSLCLVVAAMCMVGCSDQQSTLSSATDSASAPTEETVTINQVKEAAADAMKVDYKSVTCEISIATETTKVPESDDEQELMDALASTSTEGILKVDMTANPPIMYMKISMPMLSSGETEMFVTDEEVIVKDASGISKAKPEDVGLEGGIDIEKLMYEQGPFDEDILAACYKDAVKSVDGDQTVYTVNIDKEKFAKLAFTEDEQETIVKDLLESDEPMVLVYRIGSDGRLASMDYTIGMGGTSVVATSKLYDYDSTVVPEIPTE